MTTPEQWSLVDLQLELACRCIEAREHSRVVDGFLMLLRMLGNHTSHRQRLLLAARLRDTADEIENQTVVVNNDR